MLARFSSVDNTLPKWPAQAIKYTLIFEKVRIIQIFAARTRSRFLSAFVAVPAATAAASVASSSAGDTFVDFPPVNTSGSAPAKTAQIAAIFLAWATVKWFLHGCCGCDFGCYVASGFALFRHF